MQYHCEHQHVSHTYGRVMNFLNLLISQRYEVQG